MPSAGESQPCAVARQQSGWPECRMFSKQKDAGNAAQKTTTANIDNAPCLLHFIVHKPRALT
jgi:hypothetical protein